eukprot:5067627-Pleurochrysis_carterae.AAC.1
MAVMILIAFKLTVTALTNSGQPGTTDIIGKVHVRSAVEVLFRLLPRRKGAKKKSACYNTKHAAADLAMSGTCPQVSCNQSDVQSFISELSEWECRVRA